MLVTLRAECNSFARSVAALCGGTLPEELAALEPGRRGGKDRSPGSWLIYYRSLVAEHARRAQQSGPAAGLADSIGLGVLAERPLSRPSLVRPEDGTLRTLTVYPKSYETLRQMARREAHLAHVLPLQREIVASREELPSTSGNLIAGILAEHQLLAWTAMHPGLGVPWDGLEPPEDLPPHLLELRPSEVYQVRRMHEEVNHYQLTLIRELLEPPEPGRAGMSGWSTFWVGAAELLGEPEPVLMRERSMASVLFRVMLKASEQKRARAEAKAEAGAA